MLPSPLCGFFVVVIFRKYGLKGNCGPKGFFGYKIFFTEKNVVQKKFWSKN